VHVRGCQERCIGYAVAAKPCAHPRVLEARIEKLTHRCVSEVRKTGGANKNADPSPIGFGQWTTLSNSRRLPGPAGRVGGVLLRPGYVSALARHCGVCPLLAGAVHQRGGSAHVRCSWAGHGGDDG
jgi:hypothetical protein